MNYSKINKYRQVKRVKKQDEFGNMDVKQESLRVSW